MELFGNAIVVGIVLSLVLIGPVFFMLLETSVTRGWKAAITLNLGVIAADILCISIAYFGSKDLAGKIKEEPSIFIFGGFFILIYGLIMYISKPNVRLRNVSVVNRNYFKTFMNGFLLNILNIGVIVFWFFIVGTVVIQYPSEKDALLYMGTVLATFFIIDLLKIFLAQKVKESFTVRRIFYFKKTIGFILMIFGIIVIMKGFGAFEKIDQQIENKLPI